MYFKDCSIFSNIFFQDLSYYYLDLIKIAAKNIFIRRIFAAFK